MAWTISLKAKGHEFGSQIVYHLNFFYLFFFGNYLMLNVTLERYST
jgi:hypothetical protein